MIESPTSLTARKRGFTSIFRWMRGVTGALPQEETNYQDFPHHRHRYLIGKEAIAIGTLTTLFLLAAIAGEFTAFSSSPALWILIPFVTFLALHLLCAITGQLAKLLISLLRIDQAGHLDLAQGIIILTTFSGYAALRVVHPLADWFTPIAWLWLAIIAVDLFGRVIEILTSKHRTR